MAHRLKTFHPGQAPEEWLLVSKGAVGRFRPDVRWSSESGARALSSQALQPDKPSYA